MADSPANLIITNSEYILQGMHLPDDAALKKALHEAKYKELRLVPQKETSYERVKSALLVVQEVGGISIGIVGNMAP